MAFETESLPRLMSLTAHELTTPITVVSGYLRMLAREQGGPLTAKQKKMISEAEQSCARVAALAEEIRELGKLYSGKLAVPEHAIDLAALVTELASGMHEGKDRGVQLELRVTEQPIMVTGDPVRLATALKALMHAALRERGEPGALVAQCSTIDHADGHRYALVVFGHPDVLPELTAQATHASPAFFEEYRGGTGLALPVARQVIEGHGGAMWSIDGVKAASALRLPIRI